MNPYLQDRESYEDRYDRMAVEDCMRSEQFFLDASRDCETEAETRAVAAVNQCAWEIKKILLTLDWYNRKEGVVNGCRQIKTVMKCLRLRTYQKM